MTPEAQQFDRAVATLTGGALGDALGMPSQTLSRSEIAARYGEISDFLDPFPDHPVSHGLTAGQVTDDTEQTVLLAQRLIAGQGRLDEVAFAQDLLDWEQSVAARGLRDLLGPSTKAALTELLAGEPVARAGRNGTTNGAAMRIAPVGLATPLHDHTRFVDEIARACRLTHNTGEAIAAAAAVGAVISAGVEGASFDAALPGALAVAELGQKRGFAAGVPDMAMRIRSALCCGRDGPSTAQFAEEVGTSVASHESVAAAFGVVVLADGDPWRAVCIAANIGDDTDTIGAMAGAMAAACSGLGALPQRARTRLSASNDLDFAPLAQALLALRQTATAPRTAQGAAP